MGRAAWCVFLLMPAGCAVPDLGHENTASTPPPPRVLAPAAEPPKSHDELHDEIESLIEQLNVCDTVADCRQTSIHCSSRLVNAHADTTRLEQLLQHHQKLHPDQKCLLICNCGNVFCRDSRCIAVGGDCENVPDGGRTTCW